MFYCRSFDENLKFAWESFAKLDTYEIRRRPAPLCAHHSRVPKDCVGVTTELNAAMMATAAGALGTDAAVDLDLASGSDFLGGGAFV